MIRYGRIDYLDFSVTRKVLRVFEGRNERVREKETNFGWDIIF